MYLYIDKDFAVEFESNLRFHNPVDYPLEHEVNTRLYQIFTKYAGLSVFTDVLFEERKAYFIFRQIVNLNTKISSKEAFINWLLKPNYDVPILAFTGSDITILENVRSSNGLFFTSKNYIPELSKIFTREKSIRFTELNNNFNWSQLKPYLDWQTSSMVLVDNFILLNEGKISSNLKPLLSSISSNRFVKKFKVLVNRDEYRQNRRADGPIDFSDVENDIEDFIDVIDSDLSFEIKQYSRSNGKYDLHDRRLYMRYAIIEIGKGFDLLPVDAKKFTDRKIQISTIFTKDTHDDFRVFFKGIENLLH
jgi:hypothetical protein